VIIEIPLRRTDTSATGAALAFLPSGVNARAERELRAVVAEVSGSPASSQSELNRELRGEVVAAADQSSPLLPGGAPPETERQLAAARAGAVGAAAPASIAIPAVVRQARIQVDGIWCGTCALAIQVLTMRTPGVVDYAMEYRDYLATVTYDPTQTSVETIAANIQSAPGALTPAGYATTVLADARLENWTGPVGDPLPSGKPIVTYP
jgi:hypothetical protein